MLKSNEDFPRTSPATLAGRSFWANFSTGSYKHSHNKKFLPYCFLLPTLMPKATNKSCWLFKQSLRLNYERSASSIATANNVPSSGQPQSRNRPASDPSRQVTAKAPILFGLIWHLIMSGMTNCAALHCLACGRCKIMLHKRIAKIGRRVCPQSTSPPLAKSRCRSESRL